MKNFRMDYTYDGYRFWDVVAAETAEEAKEQFEHDDNGRIVFKVTETAEEPTYVVTQEELEKIRTPFWKKEGAESAEEWIEYQAYWHEIDDKAFQEALKTAPDDWDFEDVAQSYEIDAMTFEEWKKSRKN